MDYTPLYKHIEESIGTSVKHVLRDSWWIASNAELNVDDECIKVRKYLGEQDSVFMTKLDPSAPINGWLPSAFWDWYGENK